MQGMSGNGGTKPGHTRCGLRRGARRVGGAGSGITVCQENCSSREQSFLALSKASKTRRLNVSLEERRIEILCKKIDEQNPRLTTGSFSVYHRFICEPRSALSSWLPTSGTMPFCFNKPFLCKACPVMTFNEELAELVNGDSRTCPA